MKRFTIDGPITVELPDDFALTPETPAPEPQPEPEPTPEPEPKPERTLTGLTMEPNGIAVEVGDVLWFRGTLHYSDGSTATLNTNKIYAHGTQLAREGRYWDRDYTAVEPGTVEVTNTYGGFTGTAEITVVDKTDNIVDTHGFPPDDDPDEGKDPDDNDGDETEPEPEPKPPVENEDDGFPSAAARVAMPAQLGWPADKMPDNPAVVDIAVTLNDGTKLHRSDSPLGVTPMLDESGSPHRYLACVNTGAVTTVENIYMDAPGDYVGDIEITVDDETVLDEQGVRFGKRCKGWGARYGGLPAHGFVPMSKRAAYLKGVNPDSYYSRYIKSDRGFNGKGLSGSYSMHGTGLRPDIAPDAPGWAVPYLYDQSDENAEVLVGMADHAGVWPVHCRDPWTMLPISLEDHRWASIMHRLTGQGRNPIPRTAKYEGSYTPDTAHTTSFVTLAYLATGDVYLMEQLAHWGNWSNLWQNPNYRDFEKGIACGSPRAKAWTLRAICDAATHLPDDYPLKGYFGRILDNNRAYLEETFVDPGDKACGLGMITTGRLFSYGGGKIAPWQQDYLGATANRIVALGHDSWRPFAEYMARGALKRATEICIANAVFYQYKVKVNGEWLDSYPDVFDATLDPNDPRRNMACAVMDNGYEPGDQSGYPKSPTGYPAMYWPHLAAAADLGLEGGAEAFAHQRSLPTQPDFSGNASWAIVPRESAEAF